LVAGWRLGRPADRHDASCPSRLTPRQLQAALLACDGLKQPEIAIALGISPSQVARLLSQARKRMGAATTGHLVAMLVTDDSSPRRNRPSSPQPRLLPAERAMSGDPRSVTRLERHTHEARKDREWPDVLLDEIRDLRAA
jgi:DNA-binding CsgD family transcriptional regulator